MSYEPRRLDTVADAPPAGDHCRRRGARDSNLVEESRASFPTFGKYFARPATWFATKRVFDYLSRRCRRLPGAKRLSVAIGALTGSRHRDRIRWLYLRVADQMRQDKGVTKRAIEVELKKMRRDPRSDTRIERRD